MITSAVSPPCSRASASAANTSWFMCFDYRPQAPGPRPRAWLPGFLKGRFLERAVVQRAILERLGAGGEGFGEGAGTRREGQLAGQPVDVGVGDAGRHVEAHALLAGDRRLHELGPDRHRRPAAAQAQRLVVV